MRLVSPFVLQEAFSMPEHSTHKSVIVVRALPRLLSSSRIHNATWLAKETQQSRAEAPRNYPSFTALPLSDLKRTLVSMAFPILVAIRREQRVEPLPSLLVPSQAQT